MKTKYITSLDNPIVKRLKSLLETGAKSNKARQETGLAVVEGIHLAQAWLGSSDLVEIVVTEQSMHQAEIASVIDMQSASQPSTEIYIVSDAIWSKLSELQNGPEILITICLPHLTIPSQFDEDILVLDGIQDAGNVGSILRSSAASGIRHVICLKGTAQAWSSKVLRSGMGAQRHLHIYESWSLNDLRDKVKLPLFATQADAEESLFDLGRELLAPKAWVFGNEGLGVQPEILAIAKCVAIPQEGYIESLNVAAAAAVCLFENRRVKLAQN